MTRWDTAVSSGAWEDLVKQYRDLGGAEASDFELVEIIDGTRHWQISAGGIFVGIYPRTPRTEGFAGNTKSQLRRAGLVVERR